jgi:2,4-diketo-3-deoxy-L-fuconate hydrolase
MSDSFALCTFVGPDGRNTAGIAIGENVWSIASLAKADSAADNGFNGASVMDLLENWNQSLDFLHQYAAIARAGSVPALAMPSLDIRSPLEYPRQIFCTGANYRKHVVDLTVDMGVGPEGLDSEGLRSWATEMMEKRAKEGEPYSFTKPVSAIAGPTDPLVVPATTTKLDWEIELGVVIGPGGYNIPLADAMDHVAGYVIVNDISARDLIARTDYKMLGTDWLRAKGQPGFLPVGPLFVPACFISDPYDLSLRLTVSGKIMQDETTADMLFDIARQIEYTSRYARLLPGDIICTGSPAGNGTHYNRYLQPGDVMTAEITGLGRQVVECIAPS